MDSEFELQSQKFSPTSENSTKEEEEEEEDELPQFETYEQRLKFLEESNTQKYLINLNAILVCAFTIFLYGFFY